MALEDYGLHELVLEECDEYLSDTFVASPADARGRGITFSVRRDGERANGAASRLPR